MRLLVAKELDTEVQVTDTSTEVSFRLVGRRRLAEQGCVVLVALGVLIEYISCLLTAGQLTELLANNLVGLLD